MNGEERRTPGFELLEKPQRNAVENPLTGRKSLRRGFWEENPPHLFRDGIGIRHGTWKNERENRIRKKNRGIGPGFLFFAGFSGKMEG